MKDYERILWKIRTGDLSHTKIKRLLSNVLAAESLTKLHSRDRLSEQFTVYDADSETRLGLIVWVDTETGEYSEYILGPVLGVEPSVRTVKASKITIDWLDLVIRIYP